MSAKREELRKLAEELAKVEGDIYCLAKFSTQNPSNELGKGKTNSKKKPAKPNGRTKWLIIAVLILPLFPLALFCLYKAYQENKRYQEELKRLRSEPTVEEEGAALVKALEGRREELLQQMDEICKENPSLDGNYWWKTRKNPAFDGQLLPGKLPKEPEWHFLLLNQPWFRETSDGFFLEDMQSYNVGLTYQDSISMIDPKLYAIVYKNDALLTERAPGFVFAHLYAFGAEQIEEVTKHTQVTAVDKKAEMDAYRRKLDGIEIALNGLSRKALMTNEEMQLTGRSDMEEYVHDELIRGAYEADYESKVNTRGDYEEHTTYSKGFHGLYRVFLYNCADVLVSQEKETMGHCAAILVPRQAQKTVQMFVRAADRENPFKGWIESYAGHPGYEELEGGGRPSIQMAVDKLLDKADAEILHLKDRDVLMERPEGLDEYEFAYLLWKDNPKSRRAGR